MTHPVSFTTLECPDHYLVGDQAQVVRVGGSGIAQSRTYVEPMRYWHEPLLFGLLVLGMFAVFGLIFALWTIVASGLDRLRDWRRSRRR